MSEKSPVGLDRNSKTPGKKPEEKVITRVKGMREGLELLHKAPAGTEAEIALAAEEAAKKALAIIESSGRPMPKTRQAVETIKKQIVGATQRGNLKVAQGFVETLGIINRKLGEAKSEQMVLDTEKEIGKLSASLNPAKSEVKPLNVAAQMEEHGVVDTTEEIKDALKTFAAKQIAKETPKPEPAKEVAVADTSAEIEAELRKVSAKQKEKVLNEPVDDPHDPITEEGIKKITKPTKKKAAASKIAPMATRNEGPTDAIAKDAEAKWAGKEPLDTVSKVKTPKMVDATTEKKEASFKEPAEKDKGAEVLKPKVTKATEAADFTKEGDVEEGSQEKTDALAKAWEEDLGAVRKAHMKETPPEAWEEHYAEAEKAKKAAEAMGFKVEIDAANKPETKPAPEVTPAPEPTPPAPDTPSPAPASAPDVSMPAAPGTTPSTPPTPPAPLTPEQLQTSLEASRAAFAKESKEHEAARKQSRGWIGRAWEKVGGAKKDGLEKSELYKQASETYQKAKVAMAQSKLGKMDAAGKLIGPSEAISFIEKEMGDYAALLTPEKQSLLSRALQAYARMPKQYRIPISLAISTIAATGVIAATGGFATVGAAMSYAGYRGVRAGAGVLASTAVTEGVGSLRNNYIEKKQGKEKTNLTENLKADNIGDAMTRIEALAAERQKFDKKTGIYKALLATAMGGASGAYSALSHVESAGSVVGAAVPPPSGINVSPNAVFPPTEDFRSGTDLGPFVKTPEAPVWPPSEGFGDQTLPTPPAQDYGNELPRAWPPAQGFGDELPKEWPPAQGFGDAQPLTPEAPVAAPHAPSEPITVTAGDAKKGLWGILERKALADGAISERTPIGDKNALIASMEKDLRALSPEKLQELGFRPDRNGILSIDVIRPGEKLDLSMTDPENWPELGAKDINVPATSTSEVPLPPTRPNVSVQPDAPSVGIKSDVPLPPPRPSFDVPSSRTEGMPLNIHPSAEATTAVAGTSPSTGTAERLNFTPITAEQAPLSIETLNSTRVLLAKGIISPATRAAEYSNWTTIKRIIPTFEEYHKLNSELITARDTFKINLDNKTVGQVLGELAQKRSGGKVLAA